jgi:hypothetical protein
MEVRDRSGRLPAEKDQVIQKTQKSRGVVIFVALLALFGYVPLLWRSEMNYLTSLEFRWHFKHEKENFGVPKQRQELI